MRVYTSYYAKMSRDLHEMVPVTISTSVPSWFPWITEDLRILVPGWDLVMGIKEGRITQEQYTERYLSKLAGINKEEVWKGLNKISAQNGNRDIVLLCYEKRGDFCHRHLVADWLGGVEEYE